MAVFSDVAEESKTASWVGSPGIFLGNRIMKENAGGTQTGAKTERGTDQREGHTAICKTKLSPSLGGTPLFAGWRRQVSRRLIGGQLAAQAPNLKKEERKWFVV